MISSFVFRQRFSQRKTSIPSPGVCPSGHEKTNCARKATGRNSLTVWSPGKRRSTHTRKRKNCVPSRRTVAHQVNRSWELSSGLHSLLQQASSCGCGTFFEIKTAPRPGVRRKRRNSKRRSRRICRWGLQGPGLRCPKVGPPVGTGTGSFLGLETASSLKTRKRACQVFVPGGTGKGTTAQTTPCLKSACEAAILAGASWLEAGERRGFNPGNPLCMYVCNCWNPMSVRSSR